MRKSLLIGVMVLASMILIVFFLVLINKTSSIENQISYIEGSYSINVDDFRALAGDADYVFSAEVTGIEGYIYKNPVMIETVTGAKRITTPYTDYSIRVIENIKGKLQTKDDIIIQKAGGISEDGRITVIFERDVLPEIGKTYIFYAYVQDDGSLLSAGPNSCLKLANEVNNGKKKVKAADSTYKKVLDGYNHQIETDRPRSKSKYEIDE